jgi:hypothetical protein
MLHRIGWVLFVFALTGCIQTNPRSPACDGAVNRCMESCATRAESVSRPEATPGKLGTEVRQDPCEQRCANRC